MVVDALPENSGSAAPIRSHHGRHALLIVAIFGLSLGLRLWGVDFGLPERYHADEGIKTRVIGRILSGDRPEYLLHPGMMVNLVAAVAWVLRGCGLPTDGDAILLYGRIVMAFVGALTVIPIYLLGRVVLSARVGLWAALLLGVAPLHVVHSRYLKEDVLLAYWSLTTLWLLMLWLRGRQAEGAADCQGERKASRGSRRVLNWVFIAAGCALAAKYVGAIMIVIAAVATLVHLGPRNWIRIAPLCGLSLLAFLVISPQLWLDPGTARRDIGFEVKHGVGGQNSNALHIHDRYDRGVYFLRKVLLRGSMTPVTILGLAGLALALTRRRNDPAMAWLAVACLAWYLAAELTPLKRQAGMERYVLNCVPLLCLLAVHACQSAAARLATAPWMVGAMTRALPLLCAGILCANTAWLNSTLANDTRVLAARWLAERIPGGFRLMQIGLPSYEIDRRYLPMNTENYKYPRKLSGGDPAKVEAADVFALSGLAVDRYYDFPRISRKEIERLETLKAGFPFVHRIEAHPWVEIGYHNPPFEILTKRALDGMTTRTLQKAPQ